MDYSVLQVLAQGIFVLVFVLTLIDYVRSRDRQRLDVAALFGTLAAIVVLRELALLAGLLRSWVGLVGALLLLAHPYLLLRLVEHFRPVPAPQRMVALLGLLGSWALLVVYGLGLPPWALVGVVAVFVYVEGYASVAFVTEAFTTPGVTRRRLVAVAIGSLCLALLIVLAALSGMGPGPAPLVALLTGLLSLGSALGYYVGFAPPRWLRRTWQLDELYRFLAAGAGDPAQERLTRAADYLGPAAARMLGGKAAVVLLDDGGGERLSLHAGAENRAALEAAGLRFVSLGPESPLLLKAWREGRAIASASVSTWGAALRALSGAFGGAVNILVAPLATSGETYGLLVVLLDRSSLFPGEELAVLALLTERAAETIAIGRLYAEAQRRAIEHEVLVDLSRALVDEPDVR